jgi:3-oxoacyl-[acyl-carrier-protein] synthase II
MMLLAPVAITGIGCISAAGHDLAAAMECMYSGMNQPSEPRSFKTTNQKPYPVFEIGDIPTESGCAPILSLARTRDLTLIAAKQAMADASLNLEDLSKYRVGVCIGTNVGSGICHSTSFGEIQQFQKDINNPFVSRFLHSSPTIGIIDAYGLSGPSQTVVNACSAGTDALGLGASWIRNKLCDIVIAGGADAMYETTYMGFISLMITDQNPCKPFDRDRNGLNLGEGAAVFVMESSEIIKQRQKRPRGAILGYGASADGFHLTAPAPDGAGLKSAIAEALQSSGRQPYEISFINAHGTGTIENDRIESQVLAEVLPKIPFLSTKGYTGHTLGASGALEAAFSIACLEQKLLPPSGGCIIPDDSLPAKPVTRVTAIDGTLALSQSMAFGGNNAVLILGAWELAN